MSKLFWLQPDNSIVEFPIKAEQNLIGRSSRCDVRIKHPGISAEHAVIRKLPGSATVEDLGSTNGTRVNGKRIQQVHTLRHGDQIGVGRERLMYFAELDDAARFLQPESIQPFASPAPGGEHVNTASEASPAEVTSNSTPKAGSVRDAFASAPPQDIHPLLDASLISALPKGSALPARDSMPVRPEIWPAAPGPRATTPAALRAPAQVLNCSVSVLSGPAAGKRYPLTQNSVTLGKEGKQVVEFLRAGPARWQLRQLEGVTPAYINGDALSGVRDLSAGDVIELTGVRLRFEIALGSP
jgi:hypothetical protein